MAVDAFIKIDGIAGASSASKHKDEIEVLSFSWGIKNSADSGGGGGGSGKATVSDFSFTKDVARDSPSLFVSVCTGEHHKNAVLIVEGVSAAGKGGSLSFYKVTFEDVLISSVSLAGQNNALPMEQVSLNFAKVKIEYRDASGGTKAEVCDFRSGDFDGATNAGERSRQRVQGAGAFSPGPSRTCRTRRGTAGSGPSGTSACGCRGAGRDRPRAASCGRAGVAPGTSARSR